MKKSLFEFLGIYGLFNQSMRILVDKEKIELGKHRARIYLSANDLPILSNMPSTILSAGMYNMREFKIHKDENGRRYIDTVCLRYMGGNCNYEIIDRPRRPIDIHVNKRLRGGVHIKLKPSKKDTLLAFAYHGEVHIYLS